MKKPQYMKSKKEKAKEEKERSAKNVIMVKIYMRHGSKVKILRQSFFATEKRDNYNNLVSLNENMQFNQDTDFTKEDVYSSMNITLGIAEKTKDASIKLIEEKCRKINKRIVALDKHPELNKYANIWDERRKHRELQIFKKYIELRDSDGVFYKEENGYRLYEYESVDGFLIPIWHGSDTLSDYPDFTHKKKITMQETANIHAYFESKGSKKLMINALVMVLLITSALFLVNVYAGFKLIDKHQELDALASESALICADQFAKTYSDFNKIMDNTFIQQYLEEQNKSISETPPNLIKDLVVNK